MVSAKIFPTNMDKFTYLSIVNTNHFHFHHFPQNLFVDQMKTPLFSPDQNLFAPPPIFSIIFHFHPNIMRAQSIKFIIKFNFLIRFFNSYFSFSIMKKDLLLVLTVESVVLGVVLGFVIRPLNPRFYFIVLETTTPSSLFRSNDAISLIGFPGEIFMQIVEMMILPLIISSVISALAQTRAVVAGRMGLLTVG
jgi:hypothetical protein